MLGAPNSVPPCSGLSMIGNLTITRHFIRPYIYLLLTCSVSDFHVRFMFSAPHIGINQSINEVYVVPHSSPEVPPSSLYFAYI